MFEQRLQPRNRVYYGGMVAFNARGSTFACLVRNFNIFGAKIEFEGAALVPDDVDFEIRRKGISCLARMVWRNHDEAGLVFANLHETHDVVPLAWAQKLRETERANRKLRSRVDQLLSEH
jgi:PilZ domain